MPRLPSDKLPFIYMKKEILPALLALLLLAACHPAPRPVQPGPPGQALVDQAEDLVRRMRTKDHDQALDVLLAEAKGVIIVPALFRAGYLGGVDMGQGLLLAGDAAGLYSEPVFLSMGGLNFGMQAGLQRTSGIIFLMSRETLEAAARGALSLDTNLSVAAFTLGEAHSLVMAGQTPEVIAVLSPEGIYGGVALSGSGMRLDSTLLAARYGTGATAADVLFERRYYAVPGAERLQHVLSPFWKDAM